MSTTIIAVIVNILVTGLPYIGIHIVSADAQTTVATLTTIITGIWVWYQRTTLQKAPGGFGDVTASGVRK